MNQTALQQFAIFGLRILHICVSMSWFLDLTVWLKQNVTEKAPDKLCLNQKFEEEEEEKTHNKILFITWPVFK